jgi:SAM-dependent methyltransferase
MPLTTDQWHARFVEQSNWTAPLRAFLFNQAHLEGARHILEVGCGTGAITQSINHSTNAKVVGVDILYDRIKFAQKANATIGYSCADALTLPFERDHFDIAFCHYFLLWMKDQAQNALDEMVRVTRHGGMVIALAEPDYAARIDHPAELMTLGRLQTQALDRQGALTDMGVHLPELFSRAGLSNIQFGLSGFQKEVHEIPNWFDSEWETLTDDLHGEMADEELARLKALDRHSWEEGSRVLHIPTFYAIGVVK